MKKIRTFWKLHEKRKQADGNAVAVIGMACRFPNAEHYEQFWEHLMQKENAVTEIPQNRWHWEKYAVTQEKNQAAFVSRWLGSLSGIEQFDADFFHISHKEALHMDPQQRMCLEVAWDCFEDAGISVSRLQDRNVGVFAAGFNDDFYELTSRLEKAAHYATGTADTALANRISYLFDFHGPSFTIDAACAGSSVAIHTACQALRHGECAVALAGGVNLILTPTRNIYFSQMGMLSPTGSCKSFDESADGYVRGEGCGFLLLKPLRQAMKDGDCIHAVIRGSAVNHCGKSRTLTYPSAEQQADVIVQAVQQSGIPASRISYVECHGTGTPKGDPIEMEGLNIAFQTLLSVEKCKKRQFCGIGSVKSNIGHLESAAGVAGVMKTILAMEHGCLPPLLHFQQLNHRIRMEDTPFYVVQQERTWKSSGKNLLCAGVSSFGFGGVNSHIVLEQAAPMKSMQKTDKEVPYLICFSALTKESLHQRMADAAMWLNKHSDMDLAGIASTLLHGREHMEYRAAFVVHDVKELLSCCMEYQEAEKWEMRLQTHSVTEGMPQETLLEQLKSKKSQKHPQYAEMLEQLGEMYLQNEISDFSGLFGWLKGRVHFIGYPFAKTIFPLPQYEAQQPQNECQGTHSFFGYVSRLCTAKMLEHQQKGTLLVCSRENDWTPSLWNDVHWLDTAKQNDISAFETELRSCTAVRQILWVTADHAAEDAETVSQWKAEMVQIYMFIKALTNVFDSRKPLQLIFFSRTASAIGGRKPLNAGLAGVVGVLAKEYPLWNILLEDADETAEPLLLKNENNVFGAYGNTVLLRGKKAYYQILQQTALSSVQEHPQAAFRENGVYVIAGGAGGIGMYVSRYLAERYHAQLVWLGRSAADAKLEQKLAVMEQLGKKPIYIQADLSDAAQTEAAVRQIREMLPQVHGVIHSVAGALDESIQKMTPAAFEAILSAKMDTAVHLAEAFRKESLDFMLFFSSIASEQRFAGQSGYAGGCTFLDAFAAYASENCGYAVKVINWGFWGEIGIGAQMPQSAKRKLSASGMLDLEPSYCMKAIEQHLASSLTQVFYLCTTEDYAGNHQQTEDDKPLPAESTAEPIAASGDEKAWLKAEVRKLFAAEFGIAPEKLKTAEHLDLYGLDSILTVNITNRLAGIFSDVGSTLLYEYHTVDEVTEYLWTHHREQASAFYEKTKAVEMPKPAASEQQVLPQQQQKCAEDAGTEQPIAVIGMSGRFPQAEDMEAFWENLCSGKDCIEEIPSERWQMEGFYTDQQMTAMEEKMSYCKWGGFLQNIHRFDAEFFHISPKDAVSIDPQERLFLEESWKAFEDGGYSRSRIHTEYQGNVGVFVGITRTGYEWYGPQMQKLRVQIRPTTAFSSAANRISYYMDLHGPSMPVDTMCSSSLSALHLACESLRRGECRMALAGGVNVYTHPSSYIYLSSMMMLSPTGRCSSFGADADGFVPGEGVGAILLKPLQQAIADGDHIYGIIRGTGMNHNGRTNGYTVPNPNAQAELIHTVMQKAGVHSRLLSCMEAHGTGTKLGDPIEVQGLTRALRQDTDECGFCSLSSLKSNIGHLEGAAGIAGVMKVLLELQHQKLVPSLHCEVPNPRIDFVNSPLVLQRSLEAWQRPAVDIGEGLKTYPRFAGVSSFGAGGSNAFVLLEEYNAENAEKNISQ